MPTLTERFTKWLVPAGPKPLPWVPPALSAAATAPPPPMKALIAQNTPIAQDWQAKAWAYYKHVGAARQGVDWLANGLSRLHLYVGVVQSDGAGDPVPVTDAMFKPGATTTAEPPEPPDKAVADLAEEILAELHDGPVGQRDMLDKLGTALLVPGEAWLIGYPKPPAPGSPQSSPPEYSFVGEAETDTEDPGTAWAVVSRKEWMVLDGDDGIRVKLPRHPQRAIDGWVSFPTGSTVVIPIYQPDKEDATLPTSRFQSVIRDLDELDGLARRVAADIRSRLVSAGVFAVPESATVATPNQSDPGAVNPLHADPLIVSLMAAGSVAISDPDSPAAHLPIIIKISDEAIAKLQHLTFATPFDEMIPVLREAALRMVAVGLDIPSSVVTGIQDLNHWSAWAVSDEAVITHLGPLASVICTTLTREILWPVLRANGHKNVERLTIWWNASSITQRPDRTQAAIEAKRLRIINDRAARRDLGYTEDDAPQPTDVDQQQAPSNGDSGEQREGGQPEQGDTPNPPAEPSSGDTDRAKDADAPVPAPA